MGVGYDVAALGQGGKAGEKILAGLQQVCDKLLA